MTHDFLGEFFIKLPGKVQYSLSVRVTLEKSSGKTPNTRLTKNASKIAYLKIGQIKIG